MKALNIKLATFSFAALLLASCSDSNSNIIDNGGNITANTKIVGSSVTAITDAQQLASRVTNYKVKSNTNKAKKITRAGSSTTVPEGAIDITTVTGNQLEAGKDYYIPAGKTESRGFSCSQWINNANAPANIYVQGTFDLNNQWGYGNIIVLEGGKLVAISNRDEAFGEMNSIENHGTIEFSTNKSTEIIKQYVYNEGDMDLSGKYVKLCNNADLAVTGKFKAKSLEVGGGCKFNNSCSAEVTEQAYFTNYAEATFMYLKAGSIKEDSGAKLCISPNSMIICEGRWVNYNHGQGYVTLDEEGVAYIEANELEFNLPDNLKHKNSKGEVDNVTCDMFRTSGDKANIIVKVNNVYEQNVATPINKELISWNTNGNVILSDDDEAKKFSIPATECNNGGFNDNGGGSTPEPEKPTTDLVVSVEYDHTHEISATGIMPLNGYFYMSYHTNQEQADNADHSHGGCVEVFTPVQDDKIQLKQYLYDEARDLDFNHLLAVTLNSGERKVFLPGTSYKKGAMLAYMTINDDHMLATESKQITSTETDKDGKPVVKYEEPLQYVQLHPATEEFAKKGYDENCVVYNNKTDHLIVATTEGYVIYDANKNNEMNEVASYSRPGKVKHVAIGDGKIVGLYLNDRTHGSEDAVDATIEVIDRDTEDFENSKTFSVSMNIKPNDGKNVVAVNDHKIYVCQSGLGLYVYDMDGNEVGKWQMPKAWNEKKGIYKALCNGCFVDDNYVYLAYGTYGIVVLDKNTMEVVTHRKTQNSANYITVKDGYMYVAYGRSRLQVFKLAE
mgnify:FL=1